MLGHIRSTSRVILNRALLSYLAATLLCFININSAIQAQQDPKKQPQDGYRSCSKFPGSILQFYGIDPYLNFTKGEILNYDLNKTLAFPSDLIELDKRVHESDTIGLGLRENSSLELQVESEGYRLCSFNLLTSNRIGLYRHLPSTRNSRCKPYGERDEKKYQDLGEPGREEATYDYKSSVIICYFNEVPSALLRTISSVLYRSPTSMLQEILVVDDFSEPEFHHAKIRPLLKLIPGSNKVRLVRTAKREGLIRARLFGASLAKGSVLVFLDSHIEANIGWLEPLVKTIMENKTTIACPMIDLINHDTLIYSASPMVRGGLTWSLHFRWDSVPSDQLRSYSDFVKPIKSATMAGGLYAVDREFFYQIGTYDSAMELWGGENIEMSLRVWMCGGQILILPCSRVGHIFRKKRPYGPVEGQPDTHLVNTVRTALVWLDDHIERFYNDTPHARGISVGSVQDRLDLRHTLNCHNFSWFLNNVYPELLAEEEEEEEEGDRVIEAVSPVYNLFRVKSRKNLVT